jgi:type VI protein secretion system component VasF
MTQEDQLHDEVLPRKEVTPITPTPGVKVYDRPNRTLPLPTWALILLALLVVAGLWLVFTYVI